ncbi:hypothetical protein FHR33_009762 [Nonomuraea dietziae]|uniref:Uncharacterized protein n=1 Tax=Nonomuraea dietziae TaxID=65515 RepID=A0A7W5YUN8_9ACTN|nr:hypothetical protein [Nonomuraea dietziae]
MDDRERGDKHHKIRTVLAVVKLVLWILWVAFDPRRLF